MRADGLVILALSFVSGLSLSGLTIADPAITATFYADWPACRIPPSGTVVQMLETARCGTVSTGYVQADAFVLLFEASAPPGCAVQETHFQIAIQSASRIAGVSLPATITYPQANVTIDLFVGNYSPERGYWEGELSPSAFIEKRNVHTPARVSELVAVRLEIRTLELVEEGKTVPGWVAMDDGLRPTQLTLECVSGGIATSQVLGPPVRLATDCPGVPSMTVGIDTDFEFEANHLEDTHDELTATFIAVARFYCHNGIAALHFTTLHRFLSPMDPFHALSLCGGEDDSMFEYRSFAQNASGDLHPDIHVLVTGRNFGSTVVGCSFQSSFGSNSQVAIVRFPPFGSSSTPGLIREMRQYHDAILLAHELGHVLGADHDAAQPQVAEERQAPGRTIMWPQIFFNAPIFSVENADRMRFMIAQDERNEALIATLTE